MSEPTLKRKIDPSSSSSAAASSSSEAPWNVPSILALVTPFLCMWPVGLVLGVVGLLQTKEGKMRGRALAITALVLCTMELSCTVLAFVVDPPPSHGFVTRENAQATADTLERDVDADTAAGR